MNTAKKKSPASAQMRPEMPPEMPLEIRIGHGYDVHRLVADRPLILGGVEIDWQLGLLGHSDGDALLHALCDACLGALGVGDLGQHFPDSDARYKDADSRDLVRAVAAMLADARWTVGNVDATIVAQAPKLAAHLDAMGCNIAADLGVDKTRVNVKATTTEGLGFCGREEGIAAHAVVLLQR